MDIFKDTHKIIANNIYQNIYDIYNIELDKNKLLWGSVSPDILPQYRIHRHYKEKSLNYVVNEIVKLIFISRFVEFNSRIDPLSKKILSNKIGVISHYLSDFVCLPHAERWTFGKHIVKHVNYESKLNDYSIYHDFKKNIITVDDVDIFQQKVIKLRTIVKRYIEDVINEYSFTTGFENDLNFALSLSLKVSCFIIDTAEAYSQEAYRDFAFEF
ncbi:zinc dependent phospholipase C family protein [Schnuerera sp. xch1]|uniref:zinc dependent phospholipase C family protein n=1 Tax=Schnuerera sp. xch1 TaxID=2874283 RepID=UPI001CBE179F|nr:zinc dependent phospholipase C family protein [Schnuerera sp. xch1]MBZ2173985.1 zinc dependent phospholipase C family protein [Schnuerera sp. xch1]